MREDVSMNRLIDSGLAWWKLCWQVTETLAASQTVVAARMAMMEAGVRQPHRMPHAEVARMLPEKIAAFAKAGSGAAREMTGTSAVDLTAIDAATPLDLFDQWIAVSAAWWQPVHAQATSNARRLSRK